MTDAQLRALLEKHLGLRARRDDTVIYPKTGHFTDLQRYRDLAKDIAALSNPAARQPGHGRSTEPNGATA